MSTERIVSDEELNQVIEDSENGSCESLLDTAERNLPKCYELDETSGAIALDTYIINFDFRDNASHLEEILKKVPVEKFIDRLKVLDNEDFLGRNYMGAVEKMQGSIIAFIDAINKACNLNIKYKDSVDCYEFDLCFETLQDMYDNIQTLEEVKTNFMDVYTKMIKEIIAANYKINPERENDIILENTYFKLLKDGEAFSGLTFKTIEDLSTVNEGKGYDAFPSGMAMFMNNNGVNGGRVYFEFPKVEDISDKEVANG